MPYIKHSIEAVDSTGAGNAFHGAFCLFLSCGCDIETCLTLSSAVGALNCRVFRGQCELPTLTEPEWVCNAHNDLMQYGDD